MWIIQDGKSPIRSDAYFPEWKPAFSMHVLKPSVFHHRFNQILFLKIGTTPRKISFLGVTCKEELNQTIPKYVRKKKLRSIEYELSYLAYSGNITKLRLYACCV